MCAANSMSGKRRESQAVQRCVCRHLSPEPVAEACGGDLCLGEASTENGDEDEDENKDENEEEDGDEDENEQLIVQLLLQPLPGRSLFSGNESVHGRLFSAAL